MNTQTHHPNTEKDSSEESVNSSDKTETLEGGTLEKFRQPRLKDLTIFHIDDDIKEQNTRMEELQKEWGIKEGQRLGTSQSAEEAITKLRQLASEGNAPRVILLDQQFFRQAGDKVGDAYACEAFITEYQKLRTDPSFREVLKHTKIVIVSGTADDKFLEKMQQLCPDTIVGRAKKDDDTNNVIAVRLADAAVVDTKDPIISDVRKKIYPMELNAELKNRLSLRDLRKLRSGEVTSEPALLLLGLVNDARARCGFTHIETSSKQFADILSIFKTLDELDYLYISPEQLFA